MKPYVLLVEDDPTLSETVGMLLAEEGYAVVRVSTLDRALEALDLRVPDAVVLDMVLDSGHSAEPVLARAKELDAPPHFVCYSATIASGQALAEQYGATFIAKPFELDELLAAVEGAVAARDTLRPKRG